MRVYETSRRGLSLAAVAVASMIAAVLVVVLITSRAHGPSGSVPAGVGDQTTAEYVALVNADDQRIQNKPGPAVACQGSYDAPACLERIQYLDTVARKFQADLERAHPPARLAGKHTQLRADLARLESSLQESLKYLDAHDYAAMEAQAPEAEALWAAYNADILDILSTPR